MHLKRLELNGFKSFAKKSEFLFDVPIIAIVGPNGSGKSNVVEAIRFVLGEQSTKSMRAKSGADLIFKGSQQIHKMSRASVTIVFDNKKRVFHLHHHNNEKLNIDFDEISIRREVFSDGTNSYRINGHEVRMKDVHELIASVNIGSSGHHIISQGEADRYLNANGSDRRALVEEALGLKVFQYRLKESLRKLKKAEANMKESELLRRELAPHLRFLKKQVEKIERAKGLRSELEEKYQRYFAQEDYIIEMLAQKCTQKEAALDQEYDRLDLLDQGERSEPQYEEYERKEALVREQQKGSEQLLILKQELGRSEGMLAFLKKDASDVTEQLHFSRQQIKDFLVQLLESITSLKDLSLVQIRQHIQERFAHFLEGQEGRVHTPNHDELAKVQAKQEALLVDMRELEAELEKGRLDMASLDELLLEKRRVFQESQRAYFEQRARKKELDLQKDLLVNEREQLQLRKERREEEYTEACVLLGDLQLKGGFKEAVDLKEQEELRRSLERIKIRLEDIGGGSGSDVLDEYTEAQERDHFLEKEIQDLASSMTSLEKIIDELKDTLNHQFDEGIEKINEAFGRFFRMMFGGGQARLVSVALKKRKRGEEDEFTSSEEEERVEYGLDIKVQLPRKKVSDLEMLSGGERSLTSIALLFALSQVNPPPFLVLDETDAALDEANSQRYGDMVESLSKLSQLLVVTHNRETMSRAQTLFGVTLGSDDASTLLSLRLEDAAQYAK